MTTTVFDRMTMPPCATLLGWHLLDARPEEGWIRIGFEGKREFCNPAGFVQGGILSAMLDDTMGPAVFAMTDGKLFTSTISMTVNFLSPGQTRADHRRSAGDSARQDGCLCRGQADGRGRHRACDRFDQHAAGRKREGAAVVTEHVFAKTGSRLSDHALGAGPLRAIARSAAWRSAPRPGSRRRACSWRRCLPVPSATARR